MNLLVIGKSRRSYALKHVRILPATYKSQRNAWMTRNLFKEWFFVECVPAVKNNLAKLGKLNSDDSDIACLATKEAKSMAIVLKYLENIPCFQKRITR